MVLTPLCCRLALPPPDFQRRSPSSLKVGHSLGLHFFPSPSSRTSLHLCSSPCSLRSPESRLPGSGSPWVPCSILASSEVILRQAFLSSQPAQSLVGAAESGFWQGEVQNGARTRWGWWRKIERRPENHMLPQKTGTQDPGMPENNDQRAQLSLGRERCGGDNRACVEGDLSRSAPPVSPASLYTPTPAKSPDNVRSQ